MELVDIALGFLLVTIGLASTTLSAFYWTASGVTLLSFGLFVLFFGLLLLLGSEALEPLLNLSPLARAYATSTLNYWVLVPATSYAEQIRGPGWHSSLRRTRQAWIVLAVGMMVYDWVAGAPLSVNFTFLIVCAILAMIIILAHVLWWGPSDVSERHIRAVGSGLLLSLLIHDNLVGAGILPWQLSLQSLGISAFILSLGFLTARRFFTTQTELATVAHELKTASAIQSAILPQAPPAVRGLDIAVRYLPMRSVAGDMYDFLVVDQQGVGVLVADVTGHGVPAALVASMANVAFSSQASRASQPGELLTGMNRALSTRRLQGQFVTATYVFIDTQRRQVRYSNAGHPPPLLWRRGARQITELTGGSVFLGFDPDASYQTAEMAIEPGDRLLLYTDGVVEATNAAAAFFDKPRLKAFVEANADLDADRFADGLLAHLMRWSGRGIAGRSFEDDVTLAVVDIRAEF